MRVWEFENAVKEREGICIVVRAGEAEEVEDYNFARAAPENNNWTWLKGTRIRGLIGDREVIAIDGNGAKVHGGRTLRTLKASYG